MYTAFCLIMSSFSCPSCHLLFSNSNLPFQLPCGHALCYPCVSPPYPPSAQPSLQCPIDGRSHSVIPDSLQPAYFASIMGQNHDSAVSTKAHSLVEECDGRLKELHTTFDSLRSQLEARKFVLQAEASNLAARDVQLRENLLDSALRLKELSEETNTPLAPSQTKHISDKIALLQKEKFRLSCLFDKVNASRFIASIGTVQPELMRTEPFECGSFTNVTWWMLPPCCYRHYCCVKCHNLKEDHVWQYANRMICVFCGREQEYRKLPNKCMYCQRDHTGVVSK